MPEGVSRRGDSWRARYRNPETGRQHERSFAKQADAVRWRRQQLDALDRGRWVDPEAGKVSFLRYFEAWEPDQLWTDGTRAAMSLAARSTTFADVDLRRVRPSHVEAWVKSMTVPTQSRPRPLAPGTIKTRFVNVRSVFRAAVRDGMIAADPTASVRLPRQRKREAAMTIPSPEVVRRILDAADPRFRAFVGLCAFAGLRLGEAAALRVDDVDFLRRQVQVSRQVQRLTGGELDIRLPKYNSERTVHIPDALVEMLAQHVEQGLWCPWLFAGVDHQPPHQNTVGYRWRTPWPGRRRGRPAARPAPLLRLRAHRLRLRRRGRPTGPRPREIDHHADHLRPPVAHRPGPRARRLSAPRRRGPRIW